MNTPQTRRSFLRASTFALAAASLARLPALAAKPRDMKKAIMWSTVRVKRTTLE